MKTAIILTDGKAGHENQSKAFARMMGFDFVLLPVKFKSKTAKAISYLFDNIGIRTLKLFEDPGRIRTAAASHPGADVVVGTGSGTFYAAKALAAELGCKSAVLLYPRGYHIGSFGCIVSPAFDRPPHRDNVVEIPANLVASDPAFYEEGVRAFLGRHAPGGKPAVAVVIGGPNKCSTLTAEFVRRNLDAVFASTAGCERWVTTSRRTPPEVDEVVDSYPWDYKLVYSRDTFNPVPAFVALAKTLYVTAESTGMLSEACTSGSAEVRVMDNLLPGRHKFRAFVEDLRRDGYVDGNRKIDFGPAARKAAALLSGR